MVTKLKYMKNCKKLKILSGSFVFFLWSRPGLGKVTSLKSKSKVQKVKVASGKSKSKFEKVKVTFLKSKSKF